MLYLASLRLSSAGGRGGALSSCLVERARRNRFSPSISSFVAATSSSRDVSPLNADSKLFLSPAYPQDDSNPAPVTAIFVFRATPPPGLAAGSTYEVRMFERHAATTQAFIPMARGEWGGGIGEPKLEGTGGMVVLAALNGPGEFPVILVVRGGGSRCRESSFQVFRRVRGRRRADLSRSPFLGHV